MAASCGVTNAAVVDALAVLVACTPPPLVPRLSRRAMESRRRPAPPPGVIAAPPLGADGFSVPESAELPCVCPCSLAEGVRAPGPAAEDAGWCETVATAAESPGTTPAPDRRAMSALTALNHLISSSSLGAHSSSVRFVVTTLKVCFSSPPPSPSSPA